jgi:hypothetical protein
VNIVQMKFRGIIIVLFGLPALLGGCESSVTVPPIGNVTRIEIRDNSNVLISEINDKKQIHAIAEFADAHRSGWETPWAGVPVPAIVADLYDGKSFKGNIGVGPNFLETQRQGGFWSQRASRAEIKQFLDLAGVKEGKVFE